MVTNYQVAIKSAQRVFAVCACYPGHNDLLLCFKVINQRSTPYPVVRPIYYNDADKPPNLETRKMVRWIGQEITDGKIVLYDIGKFTIHNSVSDTIRVQKIYFEDIASCIASIFVSEGQSNMASHHPEYQNILKKFKKWDTVRQRIPKIAKLGFTIPTNPPKAVHIKKKWTFI